MQSSVPQSMHVCYAQHATGQGCTTHGCTDSLFAPGYMPQNEVSSLTSLAFRDAAAACDAQAGAAQGAPTSAAEPAVRCRAALRPQQQALQRLM